MCTLTDTIQVTFLAQIKSGYSGKLKLKATFDILELSTLMKNVKMVAVFFW